MEELTHRNMDDPRRPRTDDHTTPSATYQSRAQTASADEIEVDRYHNILVLPFSMHAPNGKQGHELGELIVEDDSRWKAGTRTPPDSKPQHIAEAENRLKRAERAYFHRYASDFLYPRDASTSGITIYHRNDIRWAKLYCRGPIERNNDGKMRRQHLVYQLRVGRVELHVFPAQTRQIAALVLEVDNTFGPHRWRKLVDNKEQAKRDLLAWETAGWPFNEQLDKTQETAEGSLVQSLHLSDVLRIQDELRRLFTPYWERDYADETKSDPSAEQASREAKDHFPLRPGHALTNLKWLDANLRSIADTPWQAPNHPNPGEEPPEIFPWWQELFPKTGHMDRLIPYCDDRIPSLAYVAVNDASEGIRRISEGDWARLAMLDPPDDSRRHPYSPEYHKERENAASHYYDRHFSYDPQQIQHTTRYLASNASLVVVTEAKFETEDKENRETLVIPGIGVDSEVGILAHFGHHYFKMGLILLHQRAFLLRVQQQIADAVKEYAKTQKQQKAGGEKKGEDDFRESIKSIQESFINFRGRFWFDEVTGHIQGQELYEFWQRHLKIPALYHSTAEEVEGAASFVERLVDERSMEANTSLAMIATAYAPLALIAGAAGVFLPNKEYTTITLGIYSGALLLAIIVISTLLYNGKNMIKTALAATLVVVLLTCLILTSDAYQTTWAPKLEAYLFDQDSVSSALPAAATQNPQPAEDKLSPDNETTTAISPNQSHAKDSPNGQKAQASTTEDKGTTDDSRAATKTGADQ